MATDKLDDTLRIRIPGTLKGRLRAIAATRRTKYQFEAREALYRFVEEWEAAKKSKRAA